MEVVPSGFELSHSHTFCMDNIFKHFCINEFDSAKCGDVFFRADYTDIGTEIQSQRMQQHTIRVAMAYNHPPSKLLDFVFHKLVDLTNYNLRDKLEFTKFQFDNVFTKTIDIQDGDKG